MKPVPERRARSSSPALSERSAVSPARFRAALALLGALVLYELAESAWWSGDLWGAHSYRFWPPWIGASAGAVTLLFLAWLAARSGDTETHEPTSRPSGVAAWAPWIAGAVAGLLFWLLRERHLFWGDSLPLSILVPQGQAFHPDEPLSLFLHHLLYRLGGGRWSGATAVALGSVLSGAVFVGWSVRWFSRRLPELGVAALAAVVLCTQGFTQIFYGHVENYSYLALSLLLFFTWGIDFLEGRGDPFRPLAAALFAFAFHILGGLSLVPAAVLIAVGLRDRTRRAPTLAALGIALAVTALAGILVARLYSGESPWARFVGGALKVIGNPTDMRAGHFFSARHLADIWSELTLLGPLSLLAVLTLLAILGSSAFVRRATGVFLLAGCFALLGPAWLTGAGNLGAARNWDLFAAPAVVAALLGLERVAAGLETRQARRLLAAIVVVSVFHTAPWVALNASFERASARVAALPLGAGRAPMMLGTHYLNAGDLPRAEAWFRKAIGEDPTNLNAQSGLGLALARQGKFKEAVGPMTEAVRLKPASLQLRRDLIALWVALERCDQAVPELETVLAGDPYDRRSWLTLADCHLRLAQPDSAAFVLESGLRYLPGDQEMEQILGDAYARWVVDRGRRSLWNEARQALARFESRYPADPRVARLRAALP